MVTLALEEITMEMGGDVLYCDVTLSLKEGNRYGVVGANGSGKSTLLKLLCGETEPSGGRVLWSKGARIGWLKQDQFLHQEEPLIHIVLQGRHELWDVLQQRESLLLESVWTEQCTHKLGLLDTRLEQLQAYAAESEAAKILEGLGIPAALHQEPLKSLSGGYGLRLLLARALFANPDALLLDEPTNYLDLPTLNWLEGYLIREFRGLLVLVSHDRDFLNRVSTHILDIDYTDIRIYPGNFDQFEAQKQQTALQQAQLREHLEKRIAEMQRFIDRFKAKPSRASQCMSRAKAIEKMKVPPEERSMRERPRFPFPCKRRSGAKVLEAKNLSKSYGDKSVLSRLNLRLERGEKLAIVGRNGMGKSTLMKILVGVLSADSGEVCWGHATQIGYFSQNHHDLLPRGEEVLSWIIHQSPGIPETSVRGALGASLFTPADGKKKIDHLSGGEAARLLLARLSLTGANVLVFDEPTTHLDLESIESLEKAMKSFEGTIIVVSHDRRFVQSVATRLVLVGDRGIKEIPDLSDQQLTSA